MAETNVYRLKVISIPDMCGTFKAETSRVRRERPRVRRAADLLPFCKLAHPGWTGLAPMRPWPHVLSLLDWWGSHARTVLLKSRQMGASWAMALYALHHLVSIEHRLLLALNYRQEEAAQMLQRMRVLWSSAFAKGAEGAGASWAETHAAFDNGSRAVALPVSDASGAGYSPTLVVIDEAALVPGLDEVWPAVSQGAERGQIHLISTPRGDSNFFARVVASARDGRGPFAFRRLHYREHPEKDPSTSKGRAWLAERKAELPAKDFAREHECEFVRPGAAYFDDETILQIRAGCRRPAKVLWGGRLAVWTADCGVSPIASIRNPQSAIRNRFVIGADVAEGLEGGDWSAAVVLDRRTGEQAAAYRARIGVREYAEDLVRLARMFGNACLAIEANNHGHAVCAWAHGHLKYARVLREDRAGEGAVGALGRRLGTLTTRASKPAMLAAVEEGLRSGTLLVRDERLADELSAYLRLPGGAYGAGSGAFDDRVTALMVAQDARARPVPKAA